MQDKEEADQCRKMHAIFREHGLDGQFRWLVAQKNPVRNGELYRYIAGAGAPSLGPVTANGDHARPAAG